MKESVLRLHSQIAGLVTPEMLAMLEKIGAAKGKVQRHEMAEFHRGPAPIGR